MGAIDSDLLARVDPQPAHSIARSDNERGPQAIEKRGPCLEDHHRREEREAECDIETSLAPFALLKSLFADGEETCGRFSQSGAPKGADWAEFVDLSSVEYANARQSTFLKVD